MPRPVGSFSSHPGQCAGCGLLDHPTLPVHYALCDVCVGERWGLRPTMRPEWWPAICDALADAFECTPGVAE